MKIFFASSDFDFEGITQKFFQRIGGTYSFFKSGENLLDRIRQESPDLVILDRDLDGTTGDEICFAVKNDSELRHIPVLILIAEDKSEILERCLLSGCDDYLLKPVDEHILTSKIARMLKIPFRKDLRIIFRFWLKGRTLSQFFFGNTEDISMSGMLFSTDVELNVGDIIEITFFIPASTTKISMTCKLVRVEQPEDEANYFRYGVQFLQMDELSSQYLRDYIDKLHSKDKKISEIK